MKDVAAKVLKAIKHPRKASRFIVRFLDDAFMISEYARTSERGERLVLKTDWETSKIKGDFTVFAHLARYEWVISQLRYSTKTIETLCDCGCGSGYGTAKIAMELDIPFVVGIDISQNAVKYALKHWDMPNLWFKRMDVLALRFPGDFFDCVVSFDVIEHLTEEQQHIFLHNIAKVAKPTATCFIGCPNARVSLGNNPHHKRELSSDEFISMLWKYFASVKLFCQDIVINGERIYDNWHKCLDNLKYENLGIFDTDVERAFGLLAVCTRPREKLS